MFELTKLGHSISKEKYQCRPRERLINSYLQGRCLSNLMFQVRPSDQQVHLVLSLKLAIIVGY